MTPPVRAWVRVWDRPVRLLHWLLAAGVVAAWATGHWFHASHHALGYAVGGIVAARVLWGFIGSAPARFREFVRSPTNTLRYTRQLLAGREPRHLGHNPLGGWMVLALLACAGAASLTGALYVTDWLWGYAWLENLHAALAWALPVLVALHLAGVAFTGWRHGESLVKAMVTGRKRP